MRLPRVRISLRTVLVVVALASLVLGAERLWRRSEHFRKQAALCAFFELKSRSYAATMAAEPDMTIDERTESVQGNLVEADRFAGLKALYQRIARHPWEMLPLDTPDSVNPWDLWSLSAAEIEDVVAAGVDDQVPESRNRAQTESFPSVPQTRLRLSSGKGYSMYRAVALATASP